MSKRSDESHKAESVDTVWWKFGNYTREDLMKMDPVCLRALFRERVHHTIEVKIYPILSESKEVPPNFGLQPQLILDVWREREFPDDDPDFEWGKKYLALAAKIRAGEKVEIKEPLPTLFTGEEMSVVRKLIWGRRSVRDWAPGKEIPDEMIEKILEAGRAAPVGCNLNAVRFIVIRDPEEAKMVWSDISTQNAVIVVICYDTRIPKVVGQDRSVPQNAGFDAAAAADHMLLMAHALGLGAVWLSKRAKIDTGEDTGGKV